MLNQADDIKKFPHVNDLAMLGDEPGDHACFDEIFKVIAKHGKSKRFIVALGHDHGVLPPGTIPVEHTFSNGVQVYVPTPLAEINPATTIPVAWRMSPDGVVAMDWECTKHSDGTHTFKGMPELDALLLKHVGVRFVHMMGDDTNEGTDLERATREGMKRDAEVIRERQEREAKRESDKRSRTTKKDED